MKFKFWQSEFEFDRDDAVIVIPIILLLLAFATPLPKVWLLVGAGVYYLFLLFLLDPLKKVIENQRRIRRYRCPHCRSLHTVEIGLSEYLGDVPYYWYRCNDCGEQSVFVDNKLLIPSPGRKRKLTTG